MQFFDQLRILLYFLLFLPHLFFLLLFLLLEFYLRIHLSIGFVLQHPVVLSFFILAFLSVSLQLLQLVVSHDLILPRVLFQLIVLQGLIEVPHFL